MVRLASQWIIRNVGIALDHRVCAADHLHQALRFIYRQERNGIPVFLDATSRSKREAASSPVTGQFDDPPKSISHLLTKCPIRVFSFL